jgi:hypothetical protein
MVVTALVIGILQHCLECFEVGMDISENGVFHERGIW